MMDLFVFVGSFPVLATAVLFAVHCQVDPTAVLLSLLGMDDHAKNVDDHHHDHADVDDHDDDGDDEDPDKIAKD